MAIISKKLNIWHSYGGLCISLPLRFGSGHVNIKYANNWHNEAIMLKLKEKMYSRKDDMK